MTVDQQTIELIHADIDGEIADADREHLQEILQSQPEAQRLYDEIAELCHALDDIEERAPPEHLQHLILDSIKVPQPERPAEPPFWKSFLVAPALHYAGTFAAGSLVTFLIISSNQISETAFDDVTGLVGTMTSNTAVPIEPVDSSINLTSQMLAGTVSAHRAGSIMVIDFDLAAANTVDIVASFTDRDVWFNGFAQLESNGTSVSAETGRVTLQMDGKRRYAVYLHNASGSAATVTLQFYSAGQLIHEGSLTFDGLN